MTGKTICGLVVNQIGFAHIRPFNIFLILINVFKMDFTARSNSTAVENHLVEKFKVGLVVNHIGFARIQPLNVIFIVDKHF